MNENYSDIYLPIEPYSENQFNKKKRTLVTIESRLHNTVF